jgi:outer membrane cobalamin receptor
LGLRGEQSKAIQAFNLAPRVSLAYKSSESGQFSLAYGDFYQNPSVGFVKFDNALDTEKTSHYILNYQYTGDGKTFRAEAYYKDYDKLVKYDTDRPQFNSNYNNLGSGYVKGLDVFWRDNKNIKNLDYWISYSFLDTARDYLNFEELATPNFAPKHNVSLVTKYWINDWRSQVGFSYTHASGRPYDNPNTNQFLAAKTPDHGEIYMSVSVLPIMPSTTKNVIFGTGGETIGGHLYITSISEIKWGSYMDSNYNGVYDE